jgi:N-acetylmuramoyl-L-alanine amidase
MRVKGITVQQIILGLALLAALCWNLAHANEISQLQVTEGPTGTRAELHLSAEAPYRTLRLSNPERFVVDLPDTAAARLRLPAPAGVVRAVRSGQPAPGTTRIVFDLAQPVVPLKPHVERAGDGSVRLVLEWPGDGKLATTAPAPSVPVPVAPVPSAPTTSAPAGPVASVPVSTPPPNTAPATSRPMTPAAPGVRPAMPTTPPVSASQPPPVQAPPLATAPPADKPVDKPAPAADPLPPPGKPLRDLRPGTRPLIIAIDAGHGGQDPGAHGPTGKREKDVTLAIARELARQVNATPGLKAYLTRDTDVFLPLPRRTQLARQAKADMFISIHADAAENRAAKGSSVFVLSLRGASSQRARWLADKENAADMIGGGALPRADNTLASVLIDLTQSGQMKASEDAAGHVLSGLKAIGNNHKPAIERANFAVLRTSDMPAMLVETAFISNPDEESRLTDPAYQRTIAKAVLQGVDTYFTRQPPPGTLYAVRARASEATVVASAGGLTAGGGSP